MSRGHGRAGRGAALDRTGQVWELRADRLGVAARAGLIVGRDGEGWLVVMLTGNRPGRVLSWSENHPYEDNDSMTRLA